MWKNIGVSVQREHWSFPGGLHAANGACILQVGREPGLQVRAWAAAIPEEMWGQRLEQTWRLAGVSSTKSSVGAAGSGAKSGAGLSSGLCPPAVCAGPSDAGSLQFSGTNPSPVLSGPSRCISVDLIQEIGEERKTMREIFLKLNFIV